MPATDTTLIHQSIEFSIIQDYEASLTLLDSLDARYPHRPASMFYKASVIQTRMMDFETRRWEQEFLASIDSAILRSDRCLRKNPSDLNALFYRGAAWAYKSFYAGRSGRYLKSILWARKGIQELKTVIEIDSCYISAYLGLGSYLYWRSHLTQHFNWLPFFSDQREQGIHYLQRVVQNGKLARWSAVSSLAWIYIEEQKYKQAIHLAAMGVLAFPNSRFFLWPYGDALFHDGQFSKAARIYEKLLTSVKAESINNHYNEIVLHIKLAECDLSQGAPNNAKKHLLQAIRITPAAEVSKRCREKKQRATELINGIPCESDAYTIP